METIIRYGKDQQTRKYFETLDEAIKEAVYILTNESTKHIYQDTRLVTFYSVAGGSEGECIGSSFVDIHGKLHKVCTLNILKVD